MLKLLKKSCGICKMEDVPMIKYENSSGMQIIFCYACKKYAEKRSFKVVKHYAGKKDSKRLIR
ncbi:hypothetical protein [Paenisporosarcina sp. TG20]|uniref:hypothetical protein n=1 Tax=Paenisporosarcina sp. TG20 TaxID=1211706 RepID=UPI00035F9633|nr:hypothetical protein [Paenisporosarcina sp. TG20]